MQFRKGISNMKKHLIMFLGIFIISFISAGGVPDPFGDYDSDNTLNWEDNCYYVYNPFQEDTDSDGFGDCCDPDHIGLGYCNNPGFEFCGDGICNSLENCSTCPEDCGSCPLPPECTYDSDCDAGEICVNGECENQTNNDTDKACIKYTASKNHVAVFCYPNWECGGWGECSNGIMTRKCKDTNYCVDVFNKPLEKSGCESEVIANSKIEKNNLNSIMLGAFVFLILVFILVVLFGKK